MNLPTICPIILTWFLCSGNVSAQTTRTATDLETVTARYLQWVLAAPELDYSPPPVAERYRLLKRQARQATIRIEKTSDQPAELYDTRTAGSDQREIDFLIKQSLPHLAIAYQLPGPKKIPTPIIRIKTHWRC